jgi:hypothetical protein
MQNDECHHASGRPLRLLGNAVTAGEFYRQNDIRSMRWDVVNSRSHLSELKLQCSLVGPAPKAASRQLDKSTFRPDLFVL